MESLGIAEELKCFGFLAPKPCPGFQPWEQSSFWPYDWADWDQTRLFGSCEILRRLNPSKSPNEPFRALNAYSSHVIGLYLLARLCKAHCWATLKLCMRRGIQNENVCRNSVRFRTLRSGQLQKISRPGRW